MRATSDHARRSPASARPSKACCTASVTAWRALRATPRPSRSRLPTGRACGRSSRRDSNRRDRRGFPAPERARHDLELNPGTDLDGAAAAGDARAVKRVHRRVVGGDLAEAAVLRELGYLSAHCTILEMGISRMPVEPASFSAGMSVLMSLLATTP